jgi:hypothetical protein
VAALGIFAAAAKCWVHGCESDGFYPYTLKERQGPFDFPSDEVVCGVHRDELSDPSTEWAMIESPEGWQELRVGRSLSELNEYLVLEPPTTARVYARGVGRDFSHDKDTGIHVPISVRRRGQKPETITLVIPRDVLPDLADRIQRMAEHFQQQDPPA